MKISPHKQQSVEWMIERSGIPTASEFDSLVTPEFKIRTGETPKSYLAQKVAEAWMGGPIASFNSFDMEQGQILEQEAIPYYELLKGESVQRVGLVTTDDGLVGCSPDGLIGEDNGIEIKCPAVQTHTKYLLDGGLPKDYAAQVHGAMFVTGRPRWTFFSYRRHFPPFMLTIERDEDIQEMIAEALALFLAKLQEANKRMEELNGGPPRRFNTYQRPPVPEPVNGDGYTSGDDIIP